MTFGPYRLIQLLGQRNIGINAVAFSPDGAWVADGAADSLIHISDSNSGQLLRTLEGRKGAVSSVTFSPKGRWFVSGYDDGMIRFWDTETWQPLPAFKGHNYPVMSLAISPDEQQLLSCSQDLMVSVWAIPTGQLRCDPVSLGDWAGYLTLRPDGLVIAFASLAGPIHLWDVRTAQSVAMSVDALDRRPEWARSLAIDPNGDWLASSSVDSTIDIWDAKTGDHRSTIEGHQGRVTSLIASPDGSWLASCSDHRQVRFWDVSTGRPLGTQPTPGTLTGQGCAVRALAVSPDGCRVAAGSDDGAVRLWDARTRHFECRLGRPRGWMKSLALSPDGCFLAGRLAAGSTQIWDTGTGKVLRTLDDHEDEVTNLAFSHDGRRLLGGSTHRTVQLWSMETGRGLAPLMGLEGLGHCASSLAVSPDGRWFASGANDGTLRLWSGATDTIVRTWSGHEGKVSDLAMSHDGRWLASTSSKWGVRIWDTQTGQPLDTLRPPGTLDGDTTGVTTLAFSPDGRRIATGSDIGIVQLWCAESGRCLFNLEEHKGSIDGLAFSPDSCWLASSSDDCTVRIWDAATGGRIEVHQPHPYEFASLGLAFLSVPTAPNPFADGAIWLRPLDETSIEAAHDGEPNLLITTAKIVLLGDSDVGKTALALRLAEDRFEAQQTTHGMRIWTLLPERLDPTLAAPPGERRELVLWDLGGQDEYRLVHQLFIHDTELALILFDPTRGQRQFEQVRDWNARLEAQRRGRPTAKLLVGSKLDDGDGMVDRMAVERLLVDCGADGFLPTSAMTAFRIPELRQALAKRIDWRGLARTSRSALFQRVREIIDKRTSSGDVTLPMADLKVLVERADPGDYDADAVDQVVDQLARQGAIVDTRLTSGERMLVLQIGEIERYAGSLVLAANEAQRTGGVPILDEAEVARSGFEFPRIPGAQRLLPSSERAILQCVVGLLVERGICLRQPGLLVFPSLFPEGDHEPIVGADSVSLYYDFSGPIDNLYAALVAQAAVARKFGRVRLSPGRAELEEPQLGLCGLCLKANRSGRGHLDIFFAGPVPDERRWLFRAFVESFLRENGVGVTEAVEVRCADCGHRFADLDVRNGIDQDRKLIFCPVGHPTPLDQALVNIVASSPEQERALVALRTDIERRLASSAADAKLAVGRVPVPDPDDPMGAAGGSVGAAPLLILHLSDLHFGEDTDPMDAFQALAQDIHDRDGGLGFERLDYLVLSGDLTQQGKQTEFEQVHEFLKLLFTDFRLSAKRCLIVPGNHDINWDDEVYDWRPERKVVVANFPAGHLVEQGDGYLVRDQARYGERFKHFAHFYQELMLPVYPLEPELQGVSVLHEHDRVQLIGLNSAWGIDQYFQDRAGIHAGALARALDEAEKQVRSALADGRMKEDAQDLLRIAVWHHPATGNDKIVQDAFVERLRQAGVELCLHGHVHEERADLFSYTHPRRIYMAGAGSFGAVASDRPESTPRLYNILELLPDRSRVRVHTRCRRKDGGAWEGWAGWKGKKKDERRTWYDIVLGNAGVD